MQSPNLRSVHVVRDEDFYLQHAIFLVNNRLFKVPVLHFVEASDVFRAMFQLPQDPEAKTSIDGMTDEKPIVLEGVKSEDFKQLLRVLYSRNHHDAEDLTLEQWSSVLELSSKWDMEVIRTMAIRNMTPLLNNNAHKLVVWGTNFSVGTWLSDGITSLVNRLDPMTEADAAMVGLSTTMKISAIREGSKTREIIEYQGITPFIDRRTIKEKTAPETEEQIRTTFLSTFGGNSTRT